MIKKILLQIFRSEMFPRGLQIVHYVSSDKELVDFFNEKLKKWGIDYTLTDASKESIKVLHDVISVGVNPDKIILRGGVFIEVTEIESEKLCLEMIGYLTEVKYNADLLAPIATKMYETLRQELKL